jgi:hypothetical protein
MRLLLISLFVTTLAVVSLAQEEETPTEAPIQELAPAGPARPAETLPARIGRVSFVTGNVKLRASEDWAHAVMNLPVAAGGTVRTGAQSLAEIEIGADAIDLASDTEIILARLDEQAIQIAVARGRISLALRRVGEGETVEVDFWRDGVRLLQPGRYDIDAATGRVAVLAGNSQLTGSESDLAVNSAEPATPDEFAEWCRSRDFDLTRLTAPYYLSSEVTGLTELDAAGRWETETQYGVVWIPSSQPADWAPYHDGRWRWVAPWGWTWIDTQPWGFAPSHYGRWVLLGEEWAWVPGSYVAHPVYAPAVVAFLGTVGVGLSVAGTTGPAIGWFPLAPGEVYWPSYIRELDYVRSMNFGSIRDLAEVRMEADGEPPLDVFNGHFANRRFAAVVPRGVFLNGGAVASALLDLPEQRLLNAPVLLGSPQIGPPTPRVAVAAATIRQSSRTSEWANRIALLVARNASRARALQAAFAHHLGDRSPAARLRGAHLRAPAYAQAAAPRHTILLRVAHSAKGPRQ